MKIVSQIPVIATLLTTTILGSCTSADLTETIAQGVGERQPQALVPPVAEHPEEQFRRRRAAAEEAARAERRRAGPQLQMANSSSSSEYWFVAHSLAIDTVNAAGFAGFDLDHQRSF